jgi:uncharacterized Zn ribbon protein
MLVVNKRKEKENSMNGDEKPWILDFSYRLDPIQIDQGEYDTLISDLKEKAEGATLKNGSYISLKNVHIIPNPHYVSPESVELTRKKRAALEEFKFLKREGQLETWDEYVVWKKKSVAQNKALQEYLKEPAETENEKERTT